MKKVIIGFVVLTIIILALRLLSGPEDTWIKDPTSFLGKLETSLGASKAGNWVKHGNPSAPMPTSPKPTARPAFNKEELGGFCGVNSYGKCTYDIDCYITGCSSEICQSKNEPAIFSTCIALKCHDRQKEIVCGCKNNACQWRKE